jgi:excisionase family DNA binding protein
MSNFTKLRDSPAPEPVSVPPREAARLLNVGQSRLYKLLRDGELESYRDGRARRITMKSIHDRVNRLGAADKKWQQIAPQPPRQRKRQQARA